LATKQNLTINGSGSYGGGAYHKINIRGEGTICDDFQCEIFKTFGSSTVLKNGKANQFDIFGETEIHGNLDCKVMKVFGTTRVGGTAFIEKASIMGTLEVGDRLVGEQANIKGSLSVKGDSELEIFKSSGSFEIAGLLNAGIIEVSLRYGKCRVSEIGGDKITVKRKASFLSFPKSEGLLEVRVIEGDDIILENTKAEVVRGKNIRIGTGCEIGIVEYQEDLKVDAGSVVKEQKKIR
jgi:cytoskeletal protein CcmA (bactofilin family)